MISVSDLSEIFYQFREIVFRQMILLGLLWSTECNFANYITSPFFCSLVEIILMLHLKGVNLMPNEQLQILSFCIILQKRMMIYISSDFTVGN